MRLDWTTQAKASQPYFWIRSRNKQLSDRGNIWNPEAPKDLGRCKRVGVLSTAWDAVRLIPGHHCLQSLPTAHPGLLLRGQIYASNQRKKPRYVFEGLSVAASSQLSATWPPGGAQMVCLGPGTAQVQLHPEKALLAKCRAWLLSSRF